MTTLALLALARAMLAAVAEVLKIAVHGKLWIYFWGTFGSAAVAMVDYLDSITNKRGARAPLYRDSGFLRARILMALIAGALAVGLDAQTAPAAIYMGAAAPIILRRLVASSNPRGGRVPE
jgi:hypothetical protein